MTQFLRDQAIDESNVNSLALEFGTQGHILVTVLILLSTNVLPGRGYLPTTQGLTPQEAEEERLLIDQRFLYLWNSSPSRSYF